MNDITKFESNLFEKYKEFGSTDYSRTNNEKFSERQKELLHLALNMTIVNPKFKMENFVTNGKMTPYSTIKQYMLELKAIEEATENFEFGLKKSQIEIDVLKIKLEREPDPLQKLLYEGEINLKEKDITQSKRRVKQLYIEREQYLELIEEFEADPANKTADGRSFLDIFETPEEDYYERQYWTVRLAKQAAMDLVSYGRVGHGNMDAITQMPKDLQNETLALAHQVSLKVEAASEFLRGESHKNLLELDREYRERVEKLSPQGHQEISYSSTEGNVNDVYRT